LKEVEKTALEAAFQDERASEERLLTRKIGDIPEALVWSGKRDPSGQLFRQCFPSKAGARSASFAAHMELAKQCGVPRGGRLPTSTGVVLWNIASQFPEPPRKGDSWRDRNFARQKSKRIEPPEGTPSLGR
jgi:hypothetical protein